MMDETLHDPGTDAEAVAAVRRGDAERYRELVERHERRVFAVAWSRLGDATLAEEATQEAFIRGYRRLWLLGDGAKFSGWIASVTRNVAINLGLRHRRELNKRERWALEHPGSASEHSDNPEADPRHSPETLRQTLAELPTAHRECLVLFYLEGKSGAEAAAALGISEAALRVRLHRARLALRERLEEKLESSLEKLRPSKSLVTAIMAGVLASSSAKAATAGGAGATVLGAITKLAPFKWWGAFFPLLFALPMILAGWLGYRAELANFRDKQGFRVKMYRASVLQTLLWLVVVVIVISFLMPHRLVRLNYFYLAVVGFSLMSIAMTWRQLVVNRSRFLVLIILSSLVAAGGCLLLGLQLIPTSAFNLFLGLQVLTVTLVQKERPGRMDYNLFLRAVEGMLDLSAPKAETDQPAVRFQKQELMEFARFLGTRWLVDSYRWTVGGLALRLPAFQFSRAGISGYMGIWSRRSQVLLGWDGKVSAQLCLQDLEAIMKLHPGTPPAISELEGQVVRALATAWEHYRENNFARAERVLGQVPEAEVFVQSPAQTGFTRWRLRFLMVVLALIITLTGLNWLKPPWMAWMDRLKPVSVTETEIRGFLGLVSTNPNPLIKQTIGGREGWTQKSFAWDPTMALFDCLVLPDTNLFTPRGLAAMRDSVAGGGGFVEWQQNPDRVQNIFGAPLPRRALARGWISWEELRLDPAKVADYLHTNHFKSYSPEHWDRFLTRCESWSWVKSERYPVLRIRDDGLTQLRLLRAVNSLDLVDRAKLIAQIISVQTLSSHPPGQPPIHDWKDVRGLFFTPCSPVLQDTYFSLAALEILGGLDQIDRPACIEGILKQHRGKGYFTSPDSGGFNEYHIDGSARDTIAAFESLRILGALDRVKDLEQWQFRLKTRRTSQPSVDGNRTLTWEEVEAWVCQQRLRRIIQERRENPNAPIRSLLEP
jgi:RNA polymerase sigma-70 factor (ECF subfamily)